MLVHTSALNALPTGLVGFVTDIVFEVGAALTGASIVTFMMGIGMNRQQKNALKWRDEIRRKIAEENTRP